MKNYSLFFLFLMVLPNLFFLGCRDDDDGDAISAYCRENPGDPTCPNYDPCFEVYAADSEFEIVDSISNVFTDTLIGLPVTITDGRSSTFFRANRIISNADYAWRVGNDPRVFTEPSVNLNFGGFSGTVDVNLEVTVPANNSCLFEHELISSSNKSVTFLNIPHNDFLVYGTFFGSLYEDGSLIQDTITTTITDWNLMNPNASRRVRGLPLPEDCRFNAPTGLGIPIGANYAYAISTIKYYYGPNTTDFPRSCQARNPILIARVIPQNEDEITIDYWFNKSETKRVHRQFVGLRVE